MSTLENLKKKRSSLKSRLNRLQIYVDKVSETVITDHNQSIVLIESQNRLENAQQLLSEFNTIQTDIECSLKEIPPSEILVGEEFENAFYAITSKLKLIISKINKDNVSLPTNVNNDNLNNSFNINHSNVKLPKIEMPKFSGNFENWLDFHDSFQSIIINNAELSNIQRFHYLKAALEGNAEKVLRSLPVSSENFPVAWQLLCDRYANKHLLTYNHIKAIFNMPTIQKATSSNLRHLIDNTSSHLRSLKSLQEPVQHWDTLLIFILGNKLDSNTSREWESRRSSDPSFDNLMKFLNDRAEILEKVEANRSVSDKEYVNQKKQHNSKSLLVSNIVCSFCKASHKIVHCPDFINLSVKHRYDEAKKLQLCLNCLHAAHSNKNCKYGACRKCNKKHHTLLHIDQASSSTSSSQDQSSSTTSEVVLSNYACSNKQVLLSTISIEVFDSSGKSRLCKALLDSGSQTNFITTSFCDSLGISKQNVNISIGGIGDFCSSVKYKCNVRFQSRNSSYSRMIDCLVVENICAVLPTFPINISNLNIPSSVQLADPSFNIPSRIDILIGSALFWDIIGVRQIRLGPTLPILQQTKLGWIISGSFNAPIGNSRQCNLAQKVDDLSLTRFWEIEECSSSRQFSTEENECEEHFKATHRRDSDGRFIVSLPLQDSLSKLGNSKQNAIKRFYSLERKLKSNDILKSNYVQFMNEYIALNHMSPCSDDVINEVTYYLPHHGVIKEESLTTKLRVVFDGSFPSSSGFSVNDILKVGPSIQSDLFSILLRFRQHQFVVSADIAKMYRQVLINPTQRNLQMILWRSDPLQPLQSYQLNTVTYGTASASFLATRCLLQLSIESSSKYPEASQIIAHDFYVDDLLTGSDSASTLSRLCAEIDQILKSGCFSLRKWVSNDPNILGQIQESSDCSHILHLAKQENTKTLGLLWCPHLDFLQYKINVESLPKIITKRSILSGISQIFDPLGLLTATIVKVKILLQRLWLERLDWDQTVPTDIQSDWITFREQLIVLSDLQIPRHIKTGVSTLEIHGFSDASEKAYGACIYVRSINQYDEISTHLLCAKSRVAPLKKVTLPRLELCAAQILSRLFSIVQSSLTLNFENTFFWTDSTIVLGWIRTSPHLLKTFVANRVSEISSKTDISKWRHVSSKQNPADLVSRGIDPIDLKSSDLWWHGPPFLNLDTSHWPCQPSHLDVDSKELKKSTQVMVVNMTFQFPFERFSNFNRMIRSLSYCLRFMNNSSTSNKELKITGPLVVDELNKAHNILIRIVQNEHFFEEIHCLSHDKLISSKSKILSLSPFLDEQGILRVGGRLRHSSFDFQKKHPILLPSNHIFTKLLFRREHILLFHAGPQQLLAVIREKYWPIYGRNLAKKTVHECIKCYRFNSSTVNPIMGNLPSYRVNASFPFSNTGVDYAGPFTLKDRRGKGAKTYKGYVCLFICLSSKAIHLELVSELSSESFLAALKRFISRRGKPFLICSDNGTNFVGCNNDLKELSQFLKTNETIIVDVCTNQEISWKFIPAYSPHFGGIWEAGIKSMKLHLRRVLSGALLVYEDFLTILVQIESILNSRPLSPMSSDPSDLNPITPSHLLIGRELLSIPERDITNCEDNRLKQFQRLQKIRQHFWQRWSLEYISELQQRQKWKLDGKKKLQIGSLVLVKDKHSPPLNWLLGRVTSLHPGIDGISRVASLQTTKGVIKRAVNTLCPLPIPD